jgi:hypothetical protein
MANTQSMCTSFLPQLMSAQHNFSSTNVARTVNTVDTFKAALYVTTSGSTTTTCLCASVTAYAATVNGVNEVSGTNYTAGGIVVNNATNPTSNNTSVTAGVGYWTPSTNIVYINVTLSTSFDTMLMYNASQSNSAVAVFTFGPQTVTAGTFTLTMPSNAPSSALLRLQTT